MRISKLIFFLFSFTLSQDFDSDIIQTKEVSFEVKSFSSGYEIPWGMSFLPNGKLLVTDLLGKLFLVSSDGQKKQEITGIPDVFFKSQGGLLDVEIHPQFSENNLVYFSYSHKIGKKSFTRVARGKLVATELMDMQIIFSADVKHYTPRAIHFGSRIIFFDNHVYFTVGDSYERKEAQDLNTPNGKIHRLTLEGNVPNDNPFKNEDGSTSSIWTYGNRNPQGLAISKAGVIWETEHGPRGGDELNIIRKGVNYGWPSITYGINYIGTKITDYTKMDGMEQPIWHWTPSIAVCGMTVYEHSLFKAWDGNILAASLKDEYLERVVVVDNKYVSRESIYNPGSRVRDVEVGPQGRIYVALEGPGRIVVLSPVKIISR